MLVASQTLSSHLILGRPLLLLPSHFPNIKVFSKESSLLIRWPKYWSLSFRICPSSARAVTRKFGCAALCSLYAKDIVPAYFHYLLVPAFSLEKLQPEQVFQRKMQLKFQHAIGKLSTGPWWQKYRKCLFCLSNLSLGVSSTVLLFYALAWEFGNIVNLPTKRIGFFNFCLWDEEAGKLGCFVLSDLEKMNINTSALMLSRVFVYITPVLCLFAFTTVVQALCFKDRVGWKLARFLLAICSLMLPIGVALFLLCTAKWIKVSELSAVFAALLGAQILLLVHLIIIVLYLAKLKDPLPEGKLLSEKSLP
uniref:Transmembrane protein 140 isoform X1 n=2 Tax=Pogona vitticeps TaxID=103695 RepID=A0ABM5GF84_9SAUR